MQLLMAGSSPFVRKVRICAALKGLDDAIQLVSPDAPDAAALRARNPLGKIPSLILDDGSVLFDSHVICEYLDATGPGPLLIPAPGEARWRCLTLAALADGIMEAAVLLVYEGRYRPADMHVQTWIDMQQAKIDTALGVLEAAPPAWSAQPDYGHVATACALGYLDFRHEGRWRLTHPRMVAWQDAFAAAVPAFAATAPAG